MNNAERYKNEIAEVKGKFGMSDKVVKCCYDECGTCIFSFDNNKTDGLGHACTIRKVKWLIDEYKEPVRLTRLEYDILKYLSDNTKHMYIVRNKDGKLCIFDFEPVKNKVNDWWSGRYMYGMVMFNKLFQFVQWEDSTPTLIKDVLENCEVVNDAEE